LREVIVCHVHPLNNLNIGEIKSLVASERFTKFT